MFQRISRKVFSSRFLSTTVEDATAAVKKAGRPKKVDASGNPIAPTPRRQKKADDSSDDDTTIGKRKLVEEIALAHNSTIPQAHVDKVVSTLLKQIVTHVNEGKVVKFMGFGSFQLKELTARSLRNFQTGEPLDATSYKRLGFKASKTALVSSKKSTSE